MAGEVAAQFAAALAPSAGSILPAAERLGAPDGQSGIQAEVVEQPVGGQPAHVAAIPLGRIQKRRWQQPYLGQRKCLHLGGNVFSLELDRILERQDAVYGAFAFRLRLQTGVGVWCARGRLLRLGDCRSGGK